MTEVEMQELLKQATTLSHAESTQLVGLYNLIINGATGPSWAEAHNELASYYYGHAEYQQAARHAQATLEGSESLVTTSARARAGIMACNAKDSLGQPVDIELLRESTEGAIQTGQPYQGGVGASLLGHIVLSSGNRAAARAAFERAVLLFDQSRSITGGPGMIRMLAIMEIEDGRREAARAWLEQGIRYLQQFPYAGKTARFPEAKLKALLASLDAPTP